MTRTKSSFGRSCALLSAACAFSFCTARAAHADFLLKTNDRVVFFGDSITEFHNYTRPFQDYVYARYPERHIRFFNAGWSGDVTPGALGRLDRDVLFLKPTVVTICFGMNDGQYRALDDNILNTYRTNLDGIVKQLTDKGIRVVVFSPPPVDVADDRRPALKGANYNDNLAALGNAGSEIAKKYGATYIDILHPIMATDAALKAKNPKFTMIPDAVHPNEQGGIVMAGAMLMGMGAEPMPVLADVDAKQATVPIKEQIRLPRQGNVPLYMDANSSDAARQSGFLNIAGQRIRVRNLAPGTYDVKIDGKSTGLWNDRQLSEGVLVPGTYSMTARRVYDVTNWKEQNQFNAWRNLRIVSDKTSATDGAVAGLMQADDGFNQAVQSLSAPGTPPVISIESLGLPANIGPNLALGKPYEVSDPNVYNFGIGALTDGSWSSDDSHTFATGDKDTFPKTATVDLGKTSTLTNVLLGVPPFGSTQTVRVSLSTDGQNFTEVGSYVFSQNKEEKHVLSFAATPARYVRLSYPDHFPNAAGYTPTFTFTSEVEVFGPAA